MHWNLPPKDDHMREIARMALRCCPQRVTLECLGEVVVLSAAEYARLAGTSPPSEVPAAAGASPEQEPELREVGKSAPPTEPAGEREWVWEWDEEAQAYLLPWAKDVDPAEHPGLEFLNSMQNSPLAEMFRTGEITKDEWDDAMRSVRG